MSLSARHKFSKFYLKIAVATAVLSYAQGAQAGFEWVPAPQPQKPVVKAAPPAPVVPAPVAPAPVQPIVEPEVIVESKPAPAPAAVQEPVQEEAPAMVKDEAEMAPQTLVVKQGDADEKMLPLPVQDEQPEPEVVVEVEPLSPSDAAIMGAAPETKADAEPVQENVIHTREDVITPQEFVVEQNEAVNKEDAGMKTVVVMPDDAPVTAVQKMADTKSAPKLSIMAFPENASTQAEPVEKVIADVTSSNASRAVEEEAKVVGFGSDMPLALALRQVVPANFSYSFAESVNPGQRVSWNGGKAWFDVVREMVQPIDLNVEIRGRVVHLYPTQMNVPAVEAEPQPVVEEIEVQAALSPMSITEQANAAPMMQEDEMLSPMPETARTAIRDPGESVEDVVDMAETAPEQIAFENAEPSALQNIEPASGGPLFWEAQKGESLKSTLSSWSETSNVELVWEADYDYKLDSSVLASGEFSEALSVVLSQAMEEGNTPSAVFIKPEAGSAERVKLVVTDSSASGS